MLNFLLGGAFLLMGALIVVASYVRQIANFRNRNAENRQWSSPAPFVGPIFIIVGYNALPIEFSNWIFLVFILDPDTVLMTLSIPYLFFKGLRK